MQVWILLALLAVSIWSCSITAKTVARTDAVTEKNLQEYQLSPEQARLYDHFFL